MSRSQWAMMSILGFAGAMLCVYGQPASKPLTVTVTSEGTPYTAQEAGGLLRIEPVVPYLQTLAAGGRVQDFGRFARIWAWGLPNLDIAISNRGTSGLAISGVIVDVEKSSLDPTPIPIVNPGTNSFPMHFFISNEGWGAIAKATLKFNLSASQFNSSPSGSDSGRSAPPSSFTHTLSLGDIETSQAIDVSAAMAKEGVDVEALKTKMLRRPSGYGLDPEDRNQLGAYLGTFSNASADLVGELQYSAPTVDGPPVNRHVFFVTGVKLVMGPPLVGAARPPHYDYELGLEVTGANYRKTVPVTRTLSPGTTGHIAIRVAAGKSSVHRFRLTAMSGAQTVAQSGPIEMSIFVPRSVVGMIQGH